MKEQAANIANEKPQNIARSPFNREVDMKTPAALELIESIRAHGIIQPLIVRPGTNGKPFELIAGERRWRGAMILQLETVPVILREATDTEALELQLIENKDREDLSPIEEAEKYQQILDAYAKEKPPVTGDSAIKRLVEQTGRGKSTIYELLRLTKLAPTVKAVAGKIPPSHLGLLAKLEGDQNAQERVMKEIQKPQAWESESTPSGGRILSFRNTKDLIDTEIRMAKARKDWEKLAAQHKQNGGRTLGEKDSRKNLVNGREFNYEYSGLGKTYKELMGKHAPAALLAHDSHTWQPIYYYDSAAAIAAIEKNGHKKKKATTSRRNSSSGRVKTDEQEKQAKEIDRIRAERAAAAFDEITSKAEKVSGESAVLWTWILQQIDATSGFANPGPISQRLGAKGESYYFGSTLINKLKGKTAKFLRGITIQALMPDLLDLPGGRCSTGWDPEFINACKVFGVDLPDYKVAPPKVQTPGKSKPKPKAKKKSR
jgi:ParB family chromosome partitioning protein